MKTILITGGRSGIIKSVIKKVKDDYNIYITVHTNSELETVNKIYKNYNNITCFKLDVTNEKDLNKLTKLKIDILICNAAVMESGSILDIPYEKVKKCFETNFFSVIKIIKKCINEDLKIIVISSLASFIPIPFDGVYSSSKAALSQIMRCLKLECKLTGKKVNVTVIEPGLYKTGFNEYGFKKKYEFMDIDSFFKDKINMIKRYDNIVLKILQKRKLNTITKKIVKAIKAKNPKMFYRAPFMQVLFAKLYMFFSIICK